MKAAIVGISGPELTAQEAALFRAHPPAGIILFARNIRDPAQLGALVAALRAVLPAHAVLMVDQEGGRVARLRPPHWRDHPSAAAHGALFATDPAAGLRAAWLTGALIGLDCAAAGFDVACAPVLDLGLPGAHAVIGDRAFSADPGTVARLGRALAEGLLAAGVQPVGKHAPGHGRAMVDSHLALPEVAEPDLAADWHPFAANADLPWLMTAHILYRGLDPAAPATLSPRILQGVVRDRFGFTGVLVSDDLAMQALRGTPADRALACLAAGCDVALYCSGEIAPTTDLLIQAPPLTPQARCRLEAARTLAAGRRAALDGPALETERKALLSW
ncbi:beta-N-acetylhexosaminidase [Rhodovastum atsumiense]|uniref:beta-N-acetylhexosaminidase n=1 Tax=Rhodovastum atsumiense TaxID=504468 RepID=A0A5M6IM38_9PROT|nr:beta-N-acetylhexosaminidase [Rhodovastum atsumiense]KAA5609310.1 beta-N-acetylhexosaminidase [Rhodovastum atsumiense]